MITIKDIGNERAEIQIDKGTSHTVMLLGIEMLIEILIDDSSANLNIDDLLNDLKRIYKRDNEKEWCIVHFKGHLITKKIPTNDEIEKILEKYYYNDDNGFEYD